jgi:hypothetical protein
VVSEPGCGVRAVGPRGTAGPRCGICRSRGWQLGVGCSQLPRSSREERFQARPDLSKSPDFVHLIRLPLFTLLWAFQLRVRRSDHALYTLVRLRTATITTMIIIELAITLTVAATTTAVIVALTTTTQTGTYDSLSIGTHSAARALIGAAICATAWSWHHAQRSTNSTLNALKDR